MRQDGTSDLLETIPEPLRARFGRDPKAPLQVWEAPLFAGDRRVSVANAPQGLVRPVIYTEKHERQLLIAAGGTISVRVKKE